MEYVYRIGYHSYEDSSYFELYHKDKFTNKDITEMVAEGILALKDDLVEEEYVHTKNFDNFITGDYGELNIINWLIKNKGFKKVQYEQAWSVFGWANVFSTSDWADCRTQTDLDLAKELNKRSKNV